MLRIGLFVSCFRLAKMTIRFVLLVNKQGQTRLAQYYEYLTIEERRALEGEIVRKCLARADNQVNPWPWVLPYIQLPKLHLDPFTELGL